VTAQTNVYKFASVKFIFQIRCAAKFEASRVLLPVSNSAPAILYEAILASRGCHRI